MCVCGGGVCRGVGGWRRCLGRSTNTCRNWLRVTTCGRLEVASCASGPRPVPHKDFSYLYEKMSGKGASASEAHRVAAGRARHTRALPRPELLPVRRYLASMSGANASIPRCLCRQANLAGSASQPESCARRLTVQASPCAPLEDCQSTFHELWDHTARSARHCCWATYRSTYRLLRWAPFFRAGEGQG